MRGGGRKRKSYRSKQNVLERIFPRSNTHDLTSRRRRRCRCRSCCRYFGKLFCGISLIGQGRKALAHSVSHPNAPRGRKKSFLFLPFSFPFFFSWVCKLCKKPLPLLFFWLPSLSFFFLSLPFFAFCSQRQVKTKKRGEK